MKVACVINRSTSFLAGCYPFYGADPFMLNECPHIYFVGNQPEFKHKLHKSEFRQRVFFSMAYFVFAYIPTCLSLLFCCG